MAFTAPSASFVATSEFSVNDDVAAVTVSTISNKSSIAHPSVQLVYAGEQRWACVPIPDPVTPKLIGTELMTATGVASSDPLARGLTTPKGEAKLN